MTLPEDYFPVSLGLHKQPQTFPSGGTQFLSASFCSVSTSMAADTWFFHGSKLRSTLPSSPANAHRCVEIHRILRSFPRAHPSFHRIDIPSQYRLYNGIIHRYYIRRAHERQGIFQILSAIRKRSRASMRLRFILKIAILTTDSDLS